MRLDRRQAGSLRPVRCLLRNEQALGIKVAEVEHRARATERREDVAQRTDAVHKAVATAIHDSTKQLLFCVPAALGMPRRCVLDDEGWAGWIWAGSPRQRFRYDKATERFRCESALAEQRRTARQPVEAFLVTEDFQ